MKLIQKLSLLALSGLLISCGGKENTTGKVKRSTNFSTASGIVNYGSTQDWQKKLKKGNQTLRILQLGDSHTAGDYFTDNVRTILQQRLGNGGIGLVSPIAISGQRVARVSHSHYGWSAESSRRQDGDFPIGGMIARSTSGGTVTLEARQYVSGLQNITFTAKSTYASSPLFVKGQSQTGQMQPTQGRWVYNVLTTTLPVSYTAQSGDRWEVGAINIENAKEGGVVFSSLGINGSQLTHWDKWRYNWDDDLKVSKADLVILAYGTNEAFNDDLDIAETEQTWKNTIRRIKKALPKAGILIVGAPESLRSKSGACGVRPAMLDSVQQMQHRIAQSEKIMFWSWENAMGGRCSMKSWIDQGLSAKDGVHFTSYGYQSASSKLAADLLKLAK